MQWQKTLAFIRIDKKGEEEREESVSSKKEKKRISNKEGKEMVMADPRGQTTTIDGK